MQPDPRAHRPAVTLHPCPGPGCTTQLGPSIVMCEDDLGQLPDGLRAILVAAWARGDGASAAAAAEALADALAVLDGPAVMAP